MSLEGYYLGLIVVSDAMDKHGRDWEKFCLPAITIINMLKTTGHAQARAEAWEEDTEWDPRRSQEIALEKHISQIKSSGSGRCLF